MVDFDASPDAKSRSYGPAVADRVAEQADRDTSTKSLSESVRQVILTVGNVMMGDDAAGPRLATLLQRSPAPGWQVVDGGSAPENVVHHVRTIAPKRVLVVDAAEMELRPGEACLVDEHLIVERFITTTHNLPVSFLIEALRQTVPEVYFLGIQPDLVSFGYPLSPAVERAITDIHARLQRGAPIHSLPRLEELSQAQSAGGCS